MIRLVIHRPIAISMLFLALVLLAPVAIIAYWYLVLDRQGNIDRLFHRAI